MKHGLATLISCIVLTAGCVESAAPLPATGPIVTKQFACPDPCRNLVDEGGPGGFEMLASANPNDNKHLIVAVLNQHADGTSTVDPYVSFDGGKTWTMSIIPRGADVPADHPLYQMGEASDPGGVILSDGTVLIAGVGIHDLGIAFSTVLFVARSTDGGRTFDDVQELRRTNGYLGVTDGPKLARGADGEALLVFTEINHPSVPGQQTDYEAAYFHTSDSGQTWSSAKSIRQDAGGTNPAIASDGTWYAGIIDFSLVSWVGQLADNLEAPVYVMMSNDKGTTWTSSPALPDMSWERSLFPWVAVRETPAGHDVLVTYSTAQEGLFVASLDGASTWQDPLSLPFGAVYSQLAVDDDGFTHVGYFVRGGEAPATGALTDFEVQTYAPNGTLMSQNRLGQAPQPGHYYGVVGQSDGATFLWPQFLPAPGQERALTSSSITAVLSA